MRKTYVLRINRKYHHLIRYNLERILEINGFIKKTKFTLFLTNGNHMVTNRSDTSNKKCIK